MTPTRRTFLSAVPGVAAIGIGGAWAQERMRPTMADPYDQIAQDLIASLRTQPSVGTLKVAANIYADMITVNGAAERADAFLRRPWAAVTVLDSLNSHRRHAEMHLVAPGLPMPPMTARSLEETERAVEYIRQHGLAESIRLMAAKLPNDGEPVRLDDCGQWGDFCAFWSVMTVAVCAFPVAWWECLLLIFIDILVCNFWMRCNP